MSLIFPQIYARADIGLRIGLGIPAPFQIRNYTSLAWSQSTYTAWVQQTSLIKRELRKKPAWYIWMAMSTGMNPRWGGGKVWNPKAWEGIGPFFLDTIWYNRPGTQLSLQDMHINRHPHRMMPKRQANFFNKLLGRSKEIELIEDVQGGGHKSLNEIQKQNNIYSEDKPYPRYSTKKVKDQKSLNEYKMLFRGQVAIENPQPGTSYYRPIPQAALFSSPEYMERVENFKRSHVNFFSDVDDVATGWSANDTFVSKYQQIPFYIYDIRNDKYLLLPTSVRSFTQNMTPSWSEEEFMGRIDDIPTYLKTVKEFSIDMVFSAQNPIDYLVMWRKIRLLESMLYPQYNQEAIRINPPIVRIRLGNYIQSAGRNSAVAGGAVAGYFRNLSIVPDEAMTVWQTTNESLRISKKRGDEASLEVIGTGPRHVEVSFNFKVIHDSQRVENEDGTISFYHDAVYNNGYFASSLGATHGGVARAYQTNGEALQTPSGTINQESGDGLTEDTDAIGDMNSPTGPAFIEPYVPPRESSN